MRVTVEAVARAVDRRAAALAEVARAIWRRPELGLLEFEASALHANALAEAGFEVRRGAAGLATAVVARWSGGPGPAVAFLGEYDALPGLSQDASPTRRPVTEGGPGHGCGHNLLGTAALGAALALKDVLAAAASGGSVYYFGCPAEESLNAKGFMAQAGLFDGVDVAFYFHPGNHTAATVSSCLATTTAAFVFHGQSAHAAAAPEDGRSALDAVELMNVGVNYLREHVPTDVRIHYQITNGGGAPNVVPDLASSLYFVRAADWRHLDDAYGRVVACARGAALMTGTEVEVRRTDAMWHILPNRCAAERLAAAMEALGPVPFDAEDGRFAAALQGSLPPGAVAAARRRLARLVGDADALGGGVLWCRSAGVTGDGEVGAYSTDAGDVSRVVPTGFLSVATAPLGTPGHSWQMVAAAGSSVGAKGMLYAAKAMAAAGLDLVRHPERVEQCRAEFAAATAAEPYRMVVEELIPPPHVPAGAAWREG